MASQTIDDRFVMEAEAASGGMGTIHRGRDLRTGAAVAIKVLRRARVSDERRFLREAEILANLAHPAIVPYVAHGILTDGSPYLVMDWIDGEVLDDRMADRGLSVAETVTVARRVAAALAYAHALGVVHRDIKPSNLIAPGGDLARLVVIDFGVARAASAGGGSLTETGALVGTPSYMSPEQVRGERDVGPAADVFALGCVLYACLTGRITFQGRRFLALRAKIMFWEPPPVRDLAPDVPPELAALIGRMLSKHAADRPRDGAEVLALLDALPAFAEPPDAPRARVATGLTPAPPRAATSSEPPRRVSIVVVTSAESLDEDAPPPPPDEAPEHLDDLDAPPDSRDELRDSLEDSLLAYGAALDVMPDGAMIAAVTDADSERAQARSAVRCALVLRERFPDALIGVGTGEVRVEEEAELIEDIVQALAKDAMATMFAGVVEHAPPTGGIRLDDRTAALVAQDFALVRARGAAYVPAHAAR